MNKKMMSIAITLVALLSVSVAALAAQTLPVSRVFDSYEELLESGPMFDTLEELKYAEGLTHYNFSRVITVEAHYTDGHERRYFDSLEELKANATGVSFDTLEELKYHLGLYDIGETKTIFVNEEFFKLHFSSEYLEIQPFLCGFGTRYVETITGRDYRFSHREVINGRPAEIWVCFSHRVTVQRVCNGCGTGLTPPNHTFRSGCGRRFVSW